ncbi:iron complex transport system substrate-binding protein [Cohaesibacter marisflavi]|uniref:Iron complex transport system substrate-binding protein n=1 Tax=Cohaesibacter marisflavi TaxID=655353 RepID=A0A1I5G4P6_9HYPH|nr:ABC transporter substrate-binding protein [Cohaesibacter marisflavi]SFO30952.1 iron complex transport system substrate-binding protein [Cohaesibacter marisflavi]
MVRTLLVSVLLLLGGLAPEPSFAHPHFQPQRVVSINLCTDQLAMMVAGPDQLISVSKLAFDPNTSVMVDRAKRYRMNHARAEEIIRMKPDLVLAGIYTSKNTINLLQRFGVRVEQFSPDSGFDAIRKNILRIGNLLGQHERASRLLRDFDNKLASLKKSAPKEQKVLASYEPSSYTGGAGTLANEMIKAAGLRHMGEDLGFHGSSVKLSLEALIRENPDFVMSWSQWTGGPARATQILRHPALDEWFGPERRVTVDTRYWICGGPFTVDAIADLQKKILQRERGN